MRRAPGAEGGFSLAEVVIALALVSGGMLSLGLMLTMTMSVSEHAGRLSVAQQLASQRLAQLTVLRYEDGNGDGYLDPNATCTDIDELVPANLPDEGYGEIDVNNGLLFQYDESCSGRPIRTSAALFDRASYPAGAAGELDFYESHGRFAAYRREVYVVDSDDYQDRVTNVQLSGVDPDGRDTLVVTTETPTDELPATPFVKYVLVRVKWTESGQVRHVTMSTERVFHVPES